MTFRRYGLGIPSRIPLSKKEATQRRWWVVCPHLAGGVIQGLRGNVSQVGERGRPGGPVQRSTCMYSDCRRPKQRQAKKSRARWVKQDRRSSSEAMSGSMTAGCWAVTRSHPCTQNGERWNPNWARRAGFPLHWFSNRAKAHRRRPATL